MKEKRNICYNCTHHKYNTFNKITECVAPQNDKNYCEFDKVKNLLYTDKCPFKTYDEDREYLYWN